MNKNRSFWNGPGFEKFLGRCGVVVFAVLTGVAYVNGNMYWALLMGSFVLMGVADYMDILNKWRYEIQKAEAAKESIGETVINISGSYPTAAKDYADIVAKNVKMFQDEQYPPRIEKTP